MSSVRIQTGDTEPIESLVVDVQGEPITGLTNLYVVLRRVSNGSAYFDWADNTFKAVPTQLKQQMVEIDSSRSPGAYRLDAAPHTKGFNTSVITNPQANDTYVFRLVQDGSPQNAANVPQIGEIKVGQWVDNIDVEISSRATIDDVRSVHREFGLDHLVSVNPGIVPPAANTYIRQILDKLDNLETTIEGGIFVHQNYSYNITTDVLTGNVWAESANLVVSNPTNTTITFYNSNGVAQFTMTDNAPDAQGIFRIEHPSPGFVRFEPYYSIAQITLDGGDVVAAAKGSYTIG